MSSRIDGVRRLGVMLVCLCSLIVGIALTWRILPTALESSTSVATYELLGIVGLLVLPVLVAGTLVTSKQSPIRQARAKRRESPVQFGMTGRHEAVRHGAATRSVRARARDHAITGAAGTVAEPGAARAH